MQLKLVQDYHFFDYLRCSGRGMSSRFAVKQGLLPSINRQNSRPEKDFQTITRGQVILRWLLGILSVFIFIFMMHIVTHLGLFDRDRRATEGAGQHKASGPLGSGGAEFDGKVVFAVATNTSEERVAIFVQSWALHAPGNRIILFSESYIRDSPGMATFLKDYRVELVDIVRPAEVDDVDDEEENPKPGRLGLASLQKVLEYMRDDIRKNPMSKGAALLLNAGDVVLQGDPFKDTSIMQYMPREGIVFALQGGPELGPVKVSDCPEMYDSLRDCFGSSMTEKMGRLRLINGDVVIGSQKGMVEFLVLVTDVLATRTRERCLSHTRADLAAIQYSVGEFGRDPRNVDFEFSLRDHVTSTVYGVRYGLPAKVDTRGLLRRKPPEGGLRRGPTPTVISQYSFNRYLTNMYLNKYRMYANDVIFDFNEF